MPRSPARDNPWILFVPSLLFLQFNRFLELYQKCLGSQFFVWKQIKYTSSPETTNEHSEANEVIIEAIKRERAKSQVRVLFELCRLLWTEVVLKHVSESHSFTV